MVAASERLGADSRMSGQEGPYSSPRWRFCVLICFLFFVGHYSSLWWVFLELTHNIFLLGKQSMNINYNLIQDSKRFQCWILWHSSPQDSSLTKVCVSIGSFLRQDAITYTYEHSIHRSQFILNKFPLWFPCRPGSQPGSDGEEEEGVSRCAQYLAR